MLQQRSIRTISERPFWRNGVWIWPLTAQEAASLCGCDIPELCPGPMAAIDEGDKIRTIYDGSWGGANAHIQANTEERTTAPTVMDCLHGIHWLQASQKEPGHKKLPYAHWDWPKQDDQWMLLKADVTKAHRRVKILPPEWRYQVAKLEDEWWINKVGTYGMASAQLYWGRLASILLRLLYHVYPMVDWGFVFVDDFCWLLRKSLAGPLTKCHPPFSGGLWLPVELEEDSHRPLQHLVGVHHDPRPTTSPDGTYQTRIGHCSVRQNDGQPDLHEARIGQCPGEVAVGNPAHSQNHSFRPFGNGNRRLSPLANLTSFSVALHIYSIASLRKTTIIQPLTPLRAPGGGQVMQVPQTVERHTLEVGSATTQTQAKHQVWWFHYQVKEDQHPWAFKDRKPKRRIAALEMLGTLFLTMYLCKKSSSLRGPVLLPLASDNQGNVYGLLNDYTRKMPTAGLLMEIMFQLTATSCSLMPSHVKRDYNQWADDLTHPSFEGFDSSLELMVAPLLSEFKIFPWILQHLDAQGDLPGPEPVEPAAPAPKRKKRRKC